MRPRLARARILSHGVLPRSPDQLPDLKMWAVADDLAGADLSAVSAWSDKTPGVTRSYGQATVDNQPTLRTAFINGRNVVDFVRAAPADFLKATTGLGGLLSDADACTMLWIGKPEIGTANKQCFLVTQNVAATLRQAIGWGTSGEVRNRFLRLDGDTGNVSIDTYRTKPDAANGHPENRWYAVVARHDWQSQRADVWIEGHRITEGRSTIGFGRTSATDPAEVLVGGDGGTAEGFDGQVAEFALWQRWLTDREVRSVFRYARKYGNLLTIACA